MIDSPSAAILSQMTLNDIYRSWDEYIRIGHVITGSGCSAKAAHIDDLC